MWSAIKSFFRPRAQRSPEERCDAEALARQRLQSLRENELSLGAHLRRGIPVNHGPGQASGVGTETQQTDSRGGSSKLGQASQQPIGGETRGDDFALSMVMGAATGNSMMGYTSGDSIAGGLIGASASNAASDGTSQAQD